MGRKNPKLSELNKKKIGCKNPMFGKKRPDVSERNRKNLLVGSKNPWFGKSRPNISDNMKKNNPMFSSEIAEKAIRTRSKNVGWKIKAKQSMLKARFFANTPEKRKNQSQLMKGGLAAYANSFIKNPSKPQVELFNQIKLIYPTAILNYPSLNYCIDIAIPDLKIAIEYDGIYWHKGREEYDLFRQDKLESIGWKFIRYSKIPDVSKLQQDIMEVL